LGGGSNATSTESPACRSRSAGAWLMLSMSSRDGRLYGEAASATWCAWFERRRTRAGA